MSKNSHENQRAQTAKTIQARPPVEGHQAKERRQGRPKKPSHDSERGFGWNDEFIKEEKSKQVGKQQTKRSHSYENEDIQTAETIQINRPVERPETAQGSTR